MIPKKFNAIISFCVATVLAFFPFNFIVGSKAALFSYSSMVVPALGFQHSLLYVILYFFTKSLLSSSFLWFSLLHRLPLFFATLALQTRDIRIFVVVPTISMFLFCIHAVGSQVFYYSWFWFIPMFIYFFMRDTMYTRALAASFIAHALGSVIWLYTGSIPAATWTALLPIVVIERLLIAGGMVVFIYIFKMVDTFFHEKVCA